MKRVRSLAGAVAVATLDSVGSLLQRAAFRIECKLEAEEERDRQEHARRGNFKLPHWWDVEVYPQRCRFCGQPRSDEVVAESCPKRRIS